LWRANKKKKTWVRWYPFVGSQFDSDTYGGYHVEVIWRTQPPIWWYTLGGAFLFLSALRIGRAHLSSTPLLLGGGARGAKFGPRFNGPARVKLLRTCRFAGAPPTAHSAMQAIARRIARVPHIRRPATASSALRRYSTNDKGMFLLTL
jgi:hypothetical protein